MEVPTTLFSKMCYPWIAELCQNGFRPSLVVGYCHINVAMIIPSLSFQLLLYDDFIIFSLSLKLRSDFVSDVKFVYTDNTCHNGQNQLYSESYFRYKNSISTQNRGILFSKASGLKHLRAKIEKKC